MTDQSSNRCVVLLPPGSPHYVRLFDELFSLAIREAGLVPHRIQQSLTEPFPIDRLIQDLTAAAAVFADLTINCDEIWFALGCAVALKKPLCLISSKLDFSPPLNLQDMEIIPYPAAPFPSDYRELKKNIANRLLPRRPNEIAAEPQSLPNAVPVASSTPNAAPAPIVSSTPIAPLAPAAPATPTASSAPVASSTPITSLPPAASATPIAPLAPVVASTPITPPAPVIASLSEDLTAHEVLALTIIDLHASSEGLSPRALGLEMQSSESAHLTSHAMNSLKRRRFIERRPPSGTDGVDSNTSENLFITWSGKNWLLHHRQRAKSHRSNSSIRNLMMSR
jgi:hypothetical protein